MKHPFYYILLIIIFITCPLIAFAENQPDAIKELSKDVQKLKEAKDNLTIEQKASEADKIFTKLEDNSQGEDKIMVSVLKEESNKFLTKTVEYNKFLDKVSEPGFFNLNSAQDPANLDQQIMTAKEYVNRSRVMHEYSIDLPGKIRASLKAKNISEDKINSTLRGMKQSETQAAKPASKIFATRVEHASVLLKGLEYLKNWKAKWRFDTGEGVIKFKNKEEFTIWNEEILVPLGKAEKYLSSQI